MWGGYFGWSDILGIADIACGLTWKLLQKMSGKDPKFKGCSSGSQEGEVTDAEVQSEQSLYGYF